MSRAIQRALVKRYLEIESQILDAANLNNPAAIPDLAREYEGIKAAYAIVRKVPEPRLKVELFAALMETVLRQNDHKGGWDNESARWLLGRIRIELRELTRAVARLDKLEKRKAIPPDKLRSARGDVAAEAADVANFAMFVADVTGALVDWGNE